MKERVDEGKREKSAKGGGRQVGSRQAGRKELRLRAETAGLDARAATPERVAVYRGC